MALARNWLPVIAGFVALGMLAVPSISPLILGPVALVLFFWLLRQRKVIGARRIRQSDQVLASLAGGGALR